MRERPIIMGAESVRAILEGRKTQTRRVVKATVNRGDSVDLSLAGKCEFSVNRLGKCVNFFHKDFGFYMGASQQHFQVGDRLYVKETWAKCPDGGYLYKADPIFIGCDKSDFAWDWKSSMFMPRWASRITLEITDIRVERVQDITAEDALSEGIISNEEYEARASEDNLFPCPRCKGYQVHEAFGYDYGITEVDCTYCDTQKKRYRIVWDSLNSKRGYPWESNPWVWVVTFKQVL